jgi:alpha-galactosidase
MGWNSWDCFGTTVNEEQTLGQARVMASELKALGWNYVVVDIQWYEPEPKGHAYRANAPLTMDAWGRLLPAPNRFPSSVGGCGFSNLARRIHELGLRFGLHLMRGIPRIAVERNLPIFGTDYFARDIVDRDDTCPWNPDMFGVDCTKPGAQAYYNSVFALFACWGVDYVKVDDIARPYHAHERELEAIRRAIDYTGRPIVLSLSPGETALSAAEHVQRHANLWRISDDFWDNWLSLREQFARLERWNPHRVAGGWPDADMLPLGMLDLGRRASRFTHDEQVLVMSLWAIARSPLMFGGDLTRLDEFTRALLQNREVIGVNQHSENNRPLFNRDGLMAWLADVPGSSDCYLAVVNGRDRRPLTPQSASYCQQLRSDASESFLTIDLDVSGAEKLVLVADDAHDNSQHPYVIWGEPELLDEQGNASSLKELPAEPCISWWGDVVKDALPEGGPMLLGGRRMQHGFGAHTMTWLEFELPQGVRRFRCIAGFGDASQPRDEARVVRFMVHAVPPGAGHSEVALPIEVTASELGFEPGLRVRDLWNGQELGPMHQSFTPRVPFHGAGLYRIAGRRLG